MTEMTENKLKLYSIMFAVHDREKREWTGYASFIFAYSEESIQKLLEHKYGEVRIRSIQEMPYEEGIILYGERWRKF